MKKKNKAYPSRHEEHFLKPSTGYLSWQFACLTCTHRVDTGRNGNRTLHFLIELLSDRLLSILLASYMARGDWGERRKAGEGWGGGGVRSVCTYCARMHMRRRWEDKNHDFQPVTFTSHSKKIHSKQEELKDENWAHTCTVMSSRGGAKRPL